jgi:hypothetical protein
VATPDEFKQLINEVGIIGSIYGSISLVRRGDVVNMDWVPGKGIFPSLNGKSLMPAETKGQYVNSELMYRILLRMYIGGKVPQELRDNLLGRSHSMLSTVTASANEK